MTLNSRSLVSSLLAAGYCSPYQLTLTEDLHGWVGDPVFVLRSKAPRGRPVCRGCVCSAIVAEIIPAFVNPPLNNLPPPQRKMLTLSFAILCSLKHTPDSALLFPPSSDPEDSSCHLPTAAATHQLVKIKHQISTLHTGPGKKKETYFHRRLPALC